MRKKFDIIIFGATGYTGKFAIRKALKILNDCTWAVAGRNREKLEKILLETGTKMDADFSKIPIIIADVENEKSIKEMTAQGKVIVNCCGPYILFGEVVVKACIDSGTNYVDISGEPLFIEKMQLKYHNKAQEKGVYIISACGLESIPVEMGINFLEQQFHGTVNSVESYLRIFMERSFDTSGPNLNSGTYFSAVEAVPTFMEMLKVRRKLNRNPMPQLKPKLQNRLLHKTEIEGKSRWCIPLIEPDPSVVARSQRYFYENEQKRPVQIQSYLVVSKFYEVVGCLLIGMFILLLSPLKITRNLLLKYPKFFSFGVFSNDGPDEIKMEHSLFQTKLYGCGWTTASTIENFENFKLDKKAMVTVSGKNPAYGATAVALLLSAKTILNEHSKMPSKGGVISPGMAFRDTSLIQQLKLNGFFFEYNEMD